MDTVLSAVIFVVILCLFFVILDRISKSRLRERTKNEARLRALEISDIDNMDGYSFEHYVARLLRHEGYTGVEVTPGSGDFGVDIVASKSGHRYAIQVKRQARTVSRRAVSDAVAGKDYFSCDAAMVVTNNYLSKSAGEFASSVGCEVVDRDVLAKWILKYQDSAPQRVPSSPNSRTRKTTSQPGEAPSEPASSPPPPTAQPSSDNRNSTVPPEVLQSIKTFAASDYPNDFATQADVVEEQVEAFRNLGDFKTGDVPSDVFETLLEDAAREYPADFSTQLDVLKEQIKAFQKLARYSPNCIPSEVLGKVRRQVETDYPSDFWTQHDVLEEQVESYLALKQYSVEDVPADTLKTIMEEAERDYPSDFSTQLDVIEEQIESYRKLHLLE